MKQLNKFLLESDSQLSKLLYSSIVILLAMVSIFAAEVYVPSLPLIAKELNTIPDHMQLTITLYMLVLALTQLIYGPFSDRFGRRKLLMTGLTLALIGTNLCYHAHSFHQLLIGRLVLAAGNGAALGLSRSVMRDRFSGSDLARIASYFSLSLTIAPALGPLIGGHLQHWFGWRSIFIFLAVYTMVNLLLVIFVLPETNKNPDTKLGIKKVFKYYFELLKDKNFGANVFCTSIGLAGLIVYFTTSPFLLQVDLGYSVVQYAWFALIITGGMIAGRIVNMILIRYISLAQTMLFGSFVMTVAGLAMLLCSFFSVFNVFSILIPMMFFVIGSGCIFANAAVRVLNDYSHIAGISAALFGSFQVLGAALAASVAVLLPIEQWVLAVCLFIPALVAFGICWVMRQW